MRRSLSAKSKLPTTVPVAWVSELRRGQRDLVRKWGLQGLVLALLLGIPYVNGRLRVRSIQSSYAKVAACMYAGTLTQSDATGQIDDPSGSYAAICLNHTGDWPRRCESAVRVLAREPARFLFPSVKEAEVDVQRAAQILLSEIDALSATLEPGAKIPVRPLWALEMLRSAVEENAKAAGVASTDPGSPIAFSAARRKVPTPSLLNIDAALDATVTTWGRDDVLQTAAFDARGVSYIRLGPHEMTRARLPRSGGLRSVVVGDSSEYLVWTTPIDKCGVSHCAGKSTGLSLMPVPLTKIPAPTWIAAHPFGSPSRSLAWEPTRMWMAAATFDGTAKLVEFVYADNPNPGDKAVPLPPQSKGLVEARDLVVFIDSEGKLGALALMVGPAGRMDLVLYRDSGTKRLVTLPQGWTSGWVRRCSAANSGGADAHYFVVGNDSETLAGFVRDGATSTWPVITARLPPPQRSDNPKVQGAALACAGASGLTVAFIQDNGALASLTCVPGATGCVANKLAELAETVDATYTPRGILIAYSAGSKHPQVLLRNLGLQGTLSTESIAPAPCWERWGGLCGPPGFAWVGGRLVLAARSGTNLMAVESPDAGKTWLELSSTSLVRPPGPHVIPRL
jgi:hypothetical protein